MQIMLLRHGQASFGAPDYDCLSTTGARQATLFGQYSQKNFEPFDLIVSGPMKRHRQTTDAVLEELAEPVPTRVHDGLREFDFSDLLDAARARYPEGWCESDAPRKDYYHNIRRAMVCWIKGEVDGRDGPWQDFRQGALDALNDICAMSSRRVLVSSSGGPIAIMIARVLGLHDQGIIDLMVQMKNTAMNRVLYNGSGFALDSYNDVAHLQEAGCSNLTTFS